MTCKGLLDAGQFPQPPRHQGPVQGACWQPLLLVAAAAGVARSQTLLHP
jgi:hypothetical protein